LKKVDGLAFRPEVFLWRLEESAGGKVPFFTLEVDMLAVGWVDEP
jgi:hypothetical protein